MIDQTHDPNLRSWVESANDPATNFPIQNLPFATFRKPHDERLRVGTAIGNKVLDLSELFHIGSMKELMVLPAFARVDLRRRISELLAHHSPATEAHLEALADVQLLLPCEIGDYTDFYASLHHAINVGRMFRPDNPLLPNYKWVPVGYHGRASSVVAGGTKVRRPWGQVADTPVGPPRYAPTGRLDYELELAAFIGQGNALGEPIPIAQAWEHVFGVCLLNDWSARDIQAWEYQPLGPFLGKSFATSISPWIVTTEALEPFRCAPDPRAPSDPQPLTYLQGSPADALAITLEVWLRSARMMTPVMVSRSAFAGMYWTLPQMVAHHTCNGCPLRTGDLIASGTVSGPEADSRGCLLELTWRGMEPLLLPNGQSRSFLEDGDEVILRGWCEAPGFRRIGLGDCRGVVLPAASHR
jgi:fumarylacetoacetase